MHNLVYLALVSLDIARSAPVPHSIPRTPQQSFKSEGLFEGGENKKANLEGLRLAGHPKEGFERWVIDFSDEKKEIGKIAPKFQLRYVKAEKIPLPTGGEIIRRPARFIFVFRQVQKNSIQQKQVKKLLKHSHYVKDIVLYPPIEDGDTAIEFVLKDNVLFEPFQPLQKEGRLVLDLKASKETVVD